MEPTRMYQEAVSSSSSSSSSSERWVYDVFLSFRGEDTRKSFTDHLYMSLKEAGINAFIDDNGLRRGEDIALELVQAIKGSRISIIVFSRDYAASTWCLEELVNIMECRRTLKQIVLPIFYDVDPSDVRKQTGSFQEAFVKHEDRFLITDIDKVLRWRAALIEAANLSGWDLRNTADGHEAKFIKKIVEEISKQVNSTYLFVALYPVGIDSRVKHVSSLLDVGSTQVNLAVGICGMGGTGKTTLAKATYNEFYHSFEGRSFLANVREMAKLPGGQIRLQKQLLFDVLKIKVNIGSVDEGINLIKRRLRSRRIFIIMDDVDHVVQLNAIAGSSEWFGHGSRILITTRDKHLLKVLQVDAIYMAEEMSNTESLELFSWHAFRRSYPDENRYFELSISIVDYCGGLPLALEVLGSFLFGRNIAEWESTLEKLKRIPDSQIQSKLRISYDALSDDKIKDIFLDICCFFIGKDKNYVVHILDGCGLFAEIGISVLLERCLITITEKNKLMMHDLLRDMGTEIIREESPKEPGKYTRLWNHEDVLDILTKHKGSGEIEGLVLQMERHSKVSFSTKAFAVMQRLRLLQLNFVKITGGLEYFSEELRWLCWHGFPLKCIPSNFYQEKLVAIDLRYSNLRQVWKDSHMVEKLKFLNLSHSHYLTQTPDFSKLPNLMKLILKDCKSLSEVHHSIGCLNRLVFVNLSDCRVLESLPKSFYKLKALETLILSGCSRLANLDEDLGGMISLTTLLADNTGIRKVPFSIVRLKNLKHLSLCGLRGSTSKSLPSLLWSWVMPRSRPAKSFNLLLPPSLQGLDSLRRLCLNDCNLTSDTIPKDIGSLPSLRDLELRGNDFHALPSTISGLSKLQTLYLDNCSKLLFLPDLPSNIKSLYANNCTALERMPNLSEVSNLETLSLTNCRRLVDVPGLDKLSNSMRIIHMEMCNNISTTLKESLLQGQGQLGFGGIFLPGDDIPDWFNYKDDDTSIFFEVPYMAHSNLKGFVVCIVYSSSLDCYELSSDLTSLSLINYTNGNVQTIKPVTVDVITFGEDHLWQGQMSNQVFKLEAGDEVEVIVDFGEKFIVKKTGIYLVWDKIVDQNTIECAIETDKHTIVLSSGENVNQYQAGIGCKRGFDDEAGPSSLFSTEDPSHKRLRNDSDDKQV